MILQVSRSSQDDCLLARRQGRGVDTGLSGADNRHAMHADTAFGTHTSSAQTLGLLSVDAALLAVSSLPVTSLSVPVVVSITSIVITCPAGGVLG
jgi:hypothetical protein